MYFWRAGKQTTMEEILIVEDERITSLEIKMQIKKMGYKLFGYAPSGEKAIELCQEKRPDLVLMDIMLEGELDGIETVRELKKTKYLPVIYLTAYADTETHKRASKTNPSAILSKPFSPVELEKNIKLALNK